MQDPEAMRVPRGFKASREFVETLGRKVIRVVKVLREMWVLKGPKDQ